MHVEDKPEFVLNLGTAWFLDNAEINGSTMLAEIEVINRGSPSTTIGWQAELNHDSKRTWPTSIPDGFQLLKDKVVVATFCEENRLENKAIVTPLVQGARECGWLRFDFPGTSQEQLVNAEKTVYVHDIFLREYPLNFRELGPITGGFLPGSGKPPFFKEK
jgi:hypothetical protein